MQANNKTENYPDSPRTFTAKDHLDWLFKLSCSIRDFSKAMIRVGEISCRS